MEFGKGTRPVRALAGCGVASFLAVMVLGGVAQADAARLKLDLPAQSLASALEALGAQTHAQMLYSHDLVGKLQAPSVKGEFTAEEALRLLLKGSGLDLKVTGDNAFAVVKGDSVSGSAPPVVTLDTVTTTATRTENTTFDVPASVATVTRPQIDDAQAQDMATVLRTVPAVGMDGGPRQTGQTPIIRGMFGPEIILSVDGARRDYDGGIYNPLVIDPDLVKRVDIVRGPNSASYGAGGMGGVMALETIDAGDVLKPGQAAGGWIKGGFRSGDNSYSENATAAAQQGGASILGSFTNRDVYSLHTGTGEKLVNNGDVLNGLLKGNYAPNENNDFKLSYQQAMENAITPQNPSGNSSNTNLQNTSERLRQYNASWKFQDSGAGLLDGKLSSYYTDTKIGTDPRATSLVNYEFDTETYGTSLQNTSYLTSAPWLNHRITYGIDHTLDMLKNTGNGVSNYATPDGRRTMIGGFAQDEMQIARDWTLTGALRYDTYSIPGASPASTDHLSPKATLKWQAQPFLGVFAGYAEGFRAPTLDEMFSNLQTNNALFNFKPNPNLKPETSRNLETGFTLAFDNVLRPNDSFRAKTTIFDEHVNNLIESTVVGTYTRAAPYNHFGLGPTGSTFEDENVQTAHRWGGESELNYTVGKLESGLGYSRIRVTDANTGADLFAPPDKAVLGLGYHLDDYWSLRYVGQYVASQHYDSTVSRQRDAYALHDIGTSYDRDWYRVDFGISNLFDKAYVTYNQSQTAYYTYEEGRSYNLTFKARF